MSGFIRIPREYFEHPSLSGDRFRAFFWLVQKACWKPKTFNVFGKKIELQKGQLCMSVRQIAEALEWSKSATDRFLANMKSGTLIETDSGTGKLVITICNYDLFQGNMEDGGTLSGTLSGTRLGQDWDINKESNKDKNIISSVTNVTSDCVALENSEPEKVTPKQVSECEEIWNRAASHYHWKAIKVLSKTRRDKLRSRLIELVSLPEYSNPVEAWRTVLLKAGRSRLLGRDPPTWWSFDWLTANDKNILKLIEGNYDEKFNNGQQSHPNSGNPNGKFGFSQALEHLRGQDDERPDSAEPEHEIPRIGTAR